MVQPVYSQSLPDIPPYVVRFPIISPLNEYTETKNSYSDGDSIQICSTLLRITLTGSSQNRTGQRGKDSTIQGLKNY